MNCSMHSDREAVLNCSVCGRSFCRECAEGFVVPAICDHCSARERQTAKSSVPVWVWIAIVIGGASCVGLPVIAIVAAIAIPNLIEARKTGNETAAIGALRTISSVQAQFREGDREGDRELDYATSLAELSQVGLIDNVLGSGTKSGYVFSLSGSTFDWRCSATPVTMSTGARNFIVCTDGVVRFSASGAADCSSAAIQ